MVLALLKKLFLFSRFYRDTKMNKDLQRFFPRFLKRLHIDKINLTSLEVVNITIKFVLCCRFELSNIGSLDIWLECLLILAL